MNTIENNKLIAEFMGMTYDNHNEQPNKYWELTDEQNFTSPKPYPQHKDLRFDYDWNWLMSVVEKCLTALDHNDDIYVKIHDALWSINISEVYTAVVEFIKWYNLNK